MKKFKKMLLTILAMILFSAPILTVCELNFQTTKSQLDSPVVTLYDDDNCIGFKSVDDTNTYDIYCNNRLIYSYEDLDNKSFHMYDFSYLLEDSDTYKFYVIATSTSLYLLDSEPSNVVEKVYTKIEHTEGDKVEDEISEDISFTLSKTGTLSYTPIKDASYYVYMYSNNTGLNSYPITETTVNISGTKYIPQDGSRDIYAVKLAYELYGDLYISSDIKYYNTVSCGEYTDNIYIFDGIVNDHYITTLNELRNIMYYSFVYRIEDFKIKISDTLKTKITEAYDGNYMVDKMNYAIDDAIDYYFETMAYVGNNVSGGFVNQLTNSTEYRVKISYYGVKECDTTIPVKQNQVYSQGQNSPYYDVVDYDMLGNSYDDFVSDDYFLYTECVTSEQLYWAVENKITPRVIENSRADKIYTKAKNVLREIISEDMTDYEKALAIFDWICLNTNYDYSDYSGVSVCHTSNVSHVPMLLPCYYLEGVFETGYSVCDGFSKAYSLMCNMVGIDCIRIVGMAGVSGQTGGHAWNKVLVDTNLLDSKPAQYYLVDITWTEVLSEETEELSHLYFMLSDEDVKDTHENFSGRESKYSKYVANEKYHYYQNDTFDYYNLETKTTTKYNKVIENETELKDYFYNALNNEHDGIEFVVDIDMMIAYYNSVYGANSYCSGSSVQKQSYSNAYTEYHESTDTQYIYSYVYGKGYVLSGVKYYYKLRETFLECLRDNKFKAQYFTVISNDTPVQFSDNTNDLGILYIFSNSLLINEDDDAKAIFDYMEKYELNGTYKLYVEESMLNTFEGTFVSRLYQLLEKDLEGTDLIVTATNIGETEDNMQIFEFDIRYYEN